MYKKLLSIFITIVMCLPNLPTVSVLANTEQSWTNEGTYNTEWFNGNGTSTEPYIISNASDLAGLSVLVNKGNDFSGKYIRLEDDIDLSGKQWMPIGNSNNNFRGIFDGNNHIIKNLTIGSEIEKSDIDCAGLFGSVDNSELLNIGLIDLEIFINAGNVGGLVGDNSGDIKNSYAINTITGTTTGGLVGNNSGNILNSYAITNISGIITGGLVGNNSGNILNSYAITNISGTTAGGFVGNNSGNIKNSYATTNTTNNNASGFISNNSGNIKNSYWDTDKISTGISTGNDSGLTGLNTNQMKGIDTDKTDWVNITIDELDKGDISLVEALNLGLESKYLDWMNDTQNTQQGYPKHSNLSKVSIESISLNVTETQLSVGETLDLEAIILPYNATNKLINWSVDTEGVVDIVYNNSNDTYAKISAIQEGTAIVTATTQDNNLTASCKITVNSELQSSFTVTYDSNGGIGDIQSVQVKENAKITIKQNSFEKDGYKFIGWLYDGKVYQPNETIAVNSDITFIAQWGIPVTSITLDIRKIQLNVGEILNLEAIISPINATNTNVLWNVKDSSIVNIVSNKLQTTVTGISEGTTTITAKTEDGNFIASCQITVVKNSGPKDRYSVTYEGDGGTGSNFPVQYFKTGTKIKLKTNHFTKPGYKFVGWLYNGKIYQPKDVFTVESDTIFVAKWEELTTPEKPVETKVKGVNLSIIKVVLGIGEELDLDAIISPNTAVNKNVVWSNSNSSVVDIVYDTVSDSVYGSVYNAVYSKITGLSVGTAKITVTTEDGGFTASCDVEVVNDSNGNGNGNRFVVSYDANGGIGTAPNTKPLRAGTIITIRPNPFIKYGYYFDKWLYNNQSYLPLQPFEITSDATFTAQWSEVPPARVEDVELDLVEIRLDVNEMIELEATIYPYYAANKNVSWSSSNDGIVNLVPSKQGVIITGMKEGTTTITVTTEDGGFIASCDVVVENTQAEDKFTVSYDGNGGIGTVPNVQTLKSGTEITVKPNPFTKDGYVFAGWLYDNKIYQPNQTIVVQKDITFIAQWRGEFDTPVTDVNLSVAEIKLKVGESANLEAIISPDNATNKTVFWSVDDSNVAGIVYKDNVYVTISAISEGITTIMVTTEDGYLTASCNIIVDNNNEDDNFTVTYDANGGIGDAIEIEKFKDGTEITVKSNPFRKYGYRFSGWLYDGKIYQPNQTVIIDKNITFVAQWKVIDDEGSNNGNNSNSNNNESKKDKTLYITIGSITIPYTISGVNIKIEINDELLEKLLENAKETNTILIDLSNIDGIKNIKHISFKTKGKLFKDNKVIVKGISTVTVGSSMFKNLNLDSTDIIEMSIAKGSISVDFKVNEKDITSNKHIDSLKVNYEVNDITDNTVIVKLEDNKQTIVPFSIASEDEMIFKTELLGRFEAVERAFNFSDISSHWGEKYINFMAARNIVHGKENNVFKPDDNITRAEFVTLLFGFYGIDDKELDKYKYTSFKDVKEDDWFAPYINFAVQNKIATGTGDNYFSPNEQITREQMATMLLNFSQNNSFVITTNGTNKSFADSNNISYWATNAVNTMQNANIISGRADNIFEPKSLATRAEACSIVQRFVENIVSN